MNRSIVCAPMPFALASDKAAAESATLLPGSAGPDKESEASFSDVLDSEIKDDSKPEKDRNQVEAWTIYGIAPGSVQTLPTVVALSEGVAPGADQSTVQEQVQIETVNPEGKGELKGTLEGADDLLKMRLETLKLAEQKVPSPLEANLKAREQIAEILPKPAKIAYGMVAAQGELMVSASPKQEETALEQNLSLSAEVFTDTDSEHLPGSAPAPAKPSSRETEIDYPDLAPVDGLKNEWSSFEGISESSELQPVKANEAVEIAQAIRSHVQVLKGSTQEKLDVVLRPDGQTELRLHVEKVNGQILVQARCDRGDFARLESNWSAVQKSLANQGVRVESLEHGNFSQNSNNFQNPSRAFDERPTAQHPQDTHFIEQKSRATKNPQPTANRGTVQGWQSWA